MPLGTSDHRLIERARRLRGGPPRALGLAVVIVGLATALRFSLESQLVDGLPFITYFAAVIITTLLAGLWPGILALALSSVVAWYVFLPPAYSFAVGLDTIVSLVFFNALSGINIAIIVALEKTIDRLIGQEHNVRMLIESAPNGIVVVDSEGRILGANRSTESLFGYDRAELVGRQVEVLVPGPSADKHRALRAAYHVQPQPRAMGAGRDLSGRRKDGSEFPVEIGLNPVDRAGKPAVLATVIDISERKRVQQAQQLIIHELQHRTRNLFAVVQAVAEATLFKGRPLLEARQTFYGRLTALASAYAEVSGSAWEGASLAQLVRRQLAGFSQRIAVTGCDIVIGVSAAQQFALILHELATNAIKYGALSVPGGSVAITGHVELGREGDQRFSFEWRESGGPTVVPPSRRGFGSTILLEAARGFSEDVLLEYEPDGLLYRLQVPLSAIEAAKSPLAVMQSEISVQVGR